MPHRLEEKGIKLLTDHLIKHGHVVERMHGAFDLLVDGRPAEVKTKGKEFDRIDFISLTENQKKAVNQKEFDIYIVCGLEEDNPKFYKVLSSSLVKKSPRIITSYEYDRSALKDVVKTI